MTLKLAYFSTMTFQHAVLVLVIPSHVAHPFIFLLYNMPSHLCSSPSQAVLKTGRLLYKAMLCKLTILNQSNYPDYPSPFYFSFSFCQL